MATKTNNSGAEGRTDLSLGQQKETPPTVQDGAEGRAVADAANADLNKIVNQIPGGSGDSIRFDGTQRWKRTPEEEAKSKEFDGYNRI